MTTLATLTRRDEILAAAFSQFCQYGFKKTSMADIAQATGISRASLYTYFDNKEEIFHGACVAINAESLDSVEKRLFHDEGSMTVGERVEAALLARYGRLLEITQSPHGDEIYDEKNRLCGELVQESVKHLRALLAKALKRADKSGEINLQNVGLSSVAAAELLQLSAAGLKSGAPSVKIYAKRLEGFVRLFFAGLV